MSIACPLRVYAVEGLASSCLFGNAVYISPEMETEAKKQRHILAHELSHFAHGDFFWSLMRCAVLALHWYNPLVWWAAALARQDSELWADAGALKQLGERERKNYGATLIELSARPRDKVPLLRTAISMSNGKRALIERVTMIAQRQRLNAHAVVAVIGIAAVAAGCAFAGEQQLQMTGANEPPEPTLQMAAVENEPMNAPEIDPLPPEKESNQAEPAQSSVVWDADLDGDGLMERIIVDTPSLDPGEAAGIWLEDSEGHRICDLGEVGLAHVGWRTLALTEQSGKTYLLEYSPGMFQGDANYSYAIRELRHGELADVEHWEVAFNGNPEAQKYNSAEAIESFEKRANDVWAHSRLLITTDQEVLAHLYDAYTGERLKIESRYYITREGETIRYYETMLGLPEDGADTHSAG